jgi:hypothetical protein
VSTRAIRTSTQQTACDVCGRTLLRGERAEVYLSGGTRHSVCELCTSRALHGGWVREGTLPDYEQASARVDRRRSILRRRRPRRDIETADELVDVPPAFGAGDGIAEPPPPLGLADPVEMPRSAGPAPEWPETLPRSERRSRRRRPAPAEAVPTREPASGREPRHVRAVPTSIEHKIEAAIELFNSSEHPRTVAGIARSLGLPDVSVHPSDPVASVVNVVVWWELCWYRYEVDLSDEVPSVRAAGQGYELSEMSELERLINAASDDRGRLQMDRPAAQSGN